MAQRQPGIVVCAWCRANGREHGAARAPGSQTWRAVSHEYASARSHGGLTSHGVCPACLPVLVREWGLDRPAAAVSLS